MNGEAKVSVKLEAEDEIAELDSVECELCRRDVAAVLRLQTRASDASSYAAMENEETVSVKPEGTDEIPTVSTTKITELSKPECELCRRDMAAVLRLETKDSDTSADTQPPLVHIKEEPEDATDQKILTELLAVRKFCDRTEEEEEREMVAGLIAEAEEVNADLLLSETPIKKEPQDIKDFQALEDLLSFCILCDLEDKELAQALQPVHSNVNEDLLGFCSLCDLEGKELAPPLQPVHSNAEESTKPISRNSRSKGDAVSGACGEATARGVRKSTPPEATGSGPLRAPVTDRSGGSYACSSCAETFSSKYGLVKHVFAHVSGVAAPQHVCRVCGGVFTTGRGVRRHLMRRVCTRVAEPGQSGACNLQREDSKNECRGEARQSAFEARVPQNLATPERPHTCSVCRKSFSQSSDLRRHMSVHSQKKLFKCADCGKRFKRSDHLRKHRIVHSENLPYACGECGKSFKRADSLKKHRLVHTDKRPYRCGDCGKTYKSRAILKVHTTTHAGLRPHECDICGARFTQRSSVRDHKKAHHFRERPFRCDICGAAFSRDPSRREHMRQHTGEKPHRCDVCGATFAYASVYRKHKRLTSEETQPKCGDCYKSVQIDSVLEQLGVVRAEKSSHRCLDCGKSFVRDFGLERPFKCAYCGQLFCLVSAIRKHAEVHKIRSSYECVNCGIIYKRRENLRRHHMLGTCKPDDRAKNINRARTLEKKSYMCIDCGNYYTRADALKRHQMTTCKSNDRTKTFSRVDVLKNRRKIRSAKI